MYRVLIFTERGQRLATVHARTFDQAERIARSQLVALVINPGLDVCLVHDAAAKEKEQSNDQA